MELIRLENITKEFGKGDGKVIALNDVSLQISQGELLAIVGKSGSGKSTLLNVMGSLMMADQGNYYYKGEKMNFSNIKVATRFRKEKVGFIVQYFGLIDDENVYNNIALPLKYQRAKRAEIKRKVMDSLEYLGMTDKAGAYPEQLSGGQKQRVAIARALVKESDIVLADEPTGALDEENGNAVMELLKDLHNKGKTVVIVTHDEKIAGQCDRRIEILDGKIVQDRMVG